MTYVPTWKERWEDAKPYVGPVIAVLVVLTLAGWLVWHEVLPREKAQKIVAAPTLDEAARAEAGRRLTGEVDVLEKTYRRAIEAGEGDTAIATLLDRAISRQRERLKLEPAGDTAETARLANLEAERGSLRMRTATARSLVLEREAQTAAGSIEAMDKLREALRLQREANAASGPSEIKDLQREARLARTIEQREAEPAQAAVATALTLARAALARGQRDVAQKGFTEARALQVGLGRAHPGTPYGSPVRLDEIDGELDSLKAAGLAETSALRESEGDALANAGRGQEAAAAYATAAAAQREINEKYQRSRMASAPRAEQLDVKRQTLLSAAPIAQAAAWDREIAALLRRRQNPAAAERIKAAAALGEKIAGDFPRSTAIEAALHDRLAYLGQRVGEIDALQEQVYALLVPLPGAKGMAMAKTEVTQDLFARLMNTNPSRNAGRVLPVDSVSWHEAQDFCRRLGWLLGCRVRLPKEAEFQAAQGGEEGAWSAATSGGRSHEVGKSPASTTGFFDLAGNLAESISAP